MARYPEHLAAKEYPMERGPHYICPRCHIFIDISQPDTKPPLLEDIKPIDLSAPSFVIVPENKGDGDMIRSEPYDPEPNEDKWLKSIGATLISKRIDV